STAQQELEKHLSAGAGRVLLTVPPNDTIDHMVVVGVNEQELKREHRLVSNASCTTNCLAPLAKVLDEAFTIRHGIMTTVHAYTNDQRLADIWHMDFRRSPAGTVRKNPSPFCPNPSRVPPSAPRRRHLLCTPLQALPARRR